MFNSRISTLEVFRQEAEAINFLDPAYSSHLISMAREDCCCLLMAADFVANENVTTSAGEEFAT